VFANISCDVIIIFILYIISAACESFWHDQNWRLLSAAFTGLGKFCCYAIHVETILE